MVTGHRKPRAGDHSVWNRGLLDSYPEMSAEVLWAKRVRNILFALPADKWIKKQALLDSGLHCQMLVCSIITSSFLRSRDTDTPFFILACLSLLPLRCSLCTDHTVVCCCFGSWKCPSLAQGRSLHESCSVQSSLLGHMGY